MALYRNKDGVADHARGSFATEAQAGAKAHWDLNKGKANRRARASERKSFRDSISLAAQLSRIAKRPGDSVRELTRLHAAAAAKVEPKVTAVKAK